VEGFIGLRTAFRPEGKQLNGEALQTRDQIAATYLQYLQTLAAEISAATDAIAANSLLGFQESVSRQESICASLASMADPFNCGFRSSDDPSHLCAAPAVEARIRVTIGTIRELNLQYAALLKHSSRSIALLASLCRSHTGCFQEARGPRLKYQTWSCEM